MVCLYSDDELQHGFALNSTGFVAISHSTSRTSSETTERTFFRDCIDGGLGGICSGAGNLALRFNRTDSTWQRSWHNGSRPEGAWCIANEILLPGGRSRRDCGSGVGVVSSASVESPRAYDEISNAAWLIIIQRHAEHNKIEKCARRRCVAMRTPRNLRGLLTDLLCEPCYSSSATEGEREHFVPSVPKNLP